MYICNGCGQPPGDVSTRGINQHISPADIRAECNHCRPIVAAEEAGCRTWHVTMDTHSDVYRQLDQVGIFSRTETTWSGRLGHHIQVGLRFSTNLEKTADGNAVARYGDWIILHPGGHLTVHRTPSPRPAVWVHPADRTTHTFRTTRHC
ncbi:hypothetical protein ACF07Y_43050 [Streptomyces sp. NPDC016566]|uniref:hypothetical protein n=1 Tax=Streptomyces sp. NPDC016566 TaxID=3364967 RepID=UPI0036FF8B03